MYVAPESKILMALAVAAGASATEAPSVDGDKPIDTPEEEA